MILQLFLTFLKIGAFTFGGGYAMIPLIRYEIIERRGWVAQAEFLALLGKNVRLEDAPPRHNLWMNCGKARQLGVTFSSVENGLWRCAADCGLIEDPIKEINL